MFVLYNIILVCMNMFSFILGKLTIFYDLLLGNAQSFSWIRLIVCIYLFKNALEKCENRAKDCICCIMMKIPRYPISRAWKVLFFR